MTALSLFLLDNFAAGPLANLVAAVETTPVRHYVPALTAAAGVLYVIVFALGRTAQMQRLVRLGGDWSAALVPRFLALLAFLAGALLLFSGATPAINSRLYWLERWIPLPIIELSHFFDNVAGVALLILARGVERRIDAAYHFAIAMLVAGIFLSLLRALDIEQAIVLTVMLAAFIPSRRYFYRRASIIEERFTTSWIVAILLVVFGSIALGVVQYADMQLTTDDLIRFGHRAQDARFLRATAGVLTVLVAFAAMRLFRPARPIIPRPSIMDLAAAVEIAARHPEASAQLAFLGDKYFLFNEARTGFVMYGVNGRSWVALGDPVAPVADVPALIHAFIRMVDRNGGMPVFYKVTPTLLYLYLDHGLSVVKLGEEARVSLTDFTLEGPTRRNLRRVWRKIVDEGCTFDVIAPEDAIRLLPRLREVSDAWLKSKQAREKGFSLGFFEEAYVSRYPIGVVRQNNQIVAFSTLWIAGDHEEIEIDLMRYTDDAPPGVMRYVIVETMLWAKAHGYRWCNLGMAPLSGLSAHAGAPIWNQIGVAIRGAGERFYNFQGIREFKQWFYPEWTPRFLVSAGGTSRPIVLANIASLIAGGVEGLIRK